MHKKQFMRETLLPGRSGVSGRQAGPPQLPCARWRSRVRQHFGAGGRAEAAAGEIVMWNWGGQSEECHTSAIGNAFTAETGMPLKLTRRVRCRARSRRWSTREMWMYDVRDGDLFDAVALANRSSGADRPYGRRQEQDHRWLRRWSSEPRSSSTAMPSCMTPRHFQTPLQPRGLISSIRPPRGRGHFTNGRTGRWRPRYWPMG